MATTTSDLKRTRKRDKLKNFLVGLGRNTNLELTDSSTNATATGTSPTPPTPQANAVAPKAADALVSPSHPIKAQKPFSKGKYFERDITLLWAAYVLQETPEIKELILLIAVIHDDDEDDKLSGVLETCARFIVDLASAHDDHRAEVLQAITAFKGKVQKIRTAQLSGDTASFDSLGNTVKTEIVNIKPSFLPNGKPGISERLSEVLDITIGPATTVFSVVNSASSLIPVPGIQPAVGLVVRMLQTVAQTRTNYNDMKEIVAIAGEFVISCAVSCFASTVEPSSELKRAMNKFTKKLEGIAKECNELSRLNLFSRYLQQSAHVGDLHAIRTRLIHAIELFQNETLVDIKLDTEALKRNFDFAALNGLPSHPYYTPNEYLEKSRDDVLSYVSDWIANAPESVLWIHGAAGLGKSTVAQQLIYLLQSDDRLAGGVFLKHLSNKHPINVVQTIAKLLGENYPRAIPDIAEVARKFNSAHGLLSDYLTRYIIDPVVALKYPYQLVIVLDGLDEWSNRETFLAELEHVPSPSPLKFILTSRFYHSIDRALDEISVRKYALPPASQTVLERYFHHHFKSSDIDWRGRRPDEDKIRRLANLANGLLIWAATVRSLVQNAFDERDPHVILDQILSSEAKVAARNGQQLEILYSGAISTLFPPHNQEILHDFLGATLVLPEPLSIPDFAVLTNIPERAVKEIHQRLAALRVRGDTKSDAINPARQSFHASFLEFIQFDTIETDEPSFPAISTADAHLKLANRCLQIVFREFLPSTQGQTCTYSELRGAKLYAVKFWPMHLSNGTPREPVPADSVLAEISITALRRWSALFLPHVAPRLRDQHIALDDTATFSLLHNLAIIIGREDTATIMYHTHCLEVGVRLQPDDLEAWIALANAYAKLYQHGGYKRNLEEKIAAFRQALKLTLNGPADPTSNTQSNILSSLADDLNDLFDHQGDLNVLAEAISLHRKALLLRPAPHPDRSNSLIGLANAFLRRFEHQGALDDLDESIVLHREALSLRPPPHYYRFASLTCLANALRTRFEYKGDVNDLNEAIVLNREALGFHPPPCQDSFEALSNLASALHSRFEHQGLPRDLDEAISLLREAVNLCLDRSTAIANLAVALHTRFELLGVPKDLDEAISLNREALSLIQAPETNHASLLNNLAGVLRIRFEHLGNPNDLDEAISLMREVLILRPEPHPDYSSSLHNLAGALFIRFEQQGSPDDLDEVVSLVREALVFHQAPHPRHTMSLNGLANALLTRFEQQSTRRDLDEAISLVTEALNLSPTRHPDRWDSLAILAATLLTRFKQDGSSNDLDKAISSIREALVLAPAHHLDRSRLLNILANAIRTRVRQYGAPNEIDEAILLSREALALPSAPRTGRRSSLSSLAKSLHTRFENRADRNDLDEAILLNREALSLIPARHPHRSHVLNCLAKSLRRRSELQEASNDLEEAIFLYREALALRPPSHSRYSNLLCGLASSLYRQFSKNNSLESLDEAITLYRQLLGFPSSRKRSRAWVSEQLGMALRVRYNLKGDHQDLDEAINVERAKEDHEVV